MLFRTLEDKEWKHAHFMIRVNHKIIIINLPFISVTAEADRQGLEKGKTALAIHGL